MKQVHASTSEVEAQKVRQYLVANGIEATINSDTCLPQPDSDSFPGPSWSVVVSDDDFDEALARIERFQQRIAQTKALLESDSPSVKLPKSDGWLWIQLLLVLAITNPYVSPVQIILWRCVLHLFEPTFYVCWAWEICCDLIEVSLVLLIVRVSGERWSTYGLKSRSLSEDFITGCLAFVCGVIVPIFGNSFFVNLLADLQGTPYDRPINHDYLTEFPRTPGGFFALLALSLAIGLVEELVSRAYLIPTLERLLGSTSSSVLLAAVYFGISHAHRGVVSVWSAFLIAVVFGIFFVVTRRLWPLVFAHALIDFSILIHAPQ
jgi:membrane protease YdiL (CAAX protease family)